MYIRPSIYVGELKLVYHHFGINKSIMDEKLFGVYEHDICNDRPVLMRDSMILDATLSSLQFSLQQIKENRDLELLAGSEPTGAAIVVRSLDNKHIFVYLVMLNTIGTHLTVSTCGI